MKAGNDAIGPGTLRASRLQFFVAGFVFATWGVHIPTVKAHYGLDEAQLGIALLAAGLGALLGITQASRWIGRHGTRGTARICGIAYGLLLAMLLVMPSYAALLLLLAGFGMLTSMFDVTINTEAAELELRKARPLMSGMHGMFSLGGMAGALIGSAAIGNGISPGTHLLATAIVMALAAAGASRSMLPKAATASAGSDASFRLPRGALAVLGLLAALGLIAEGAIYDWSVLYMKQSLGSPQAQAALAYASFSAAMAAARFGGDAMRARFKPSTLLRGSALLAAASMTLALSVELPWIALAGFAGAGVGFANVVPILFAASARVPGVEPATGIAAVSSAAYLGFMAGPPVIGFIAKSSSLAAALFVVVAFAVALAASAHRTDPA